MKKIVLLIFATLLLFGTRAEAYDPYADQIKIDDAGNIITGTEVETALQENRTAIDLNTAKVISDTAYDATSWDANTDAATKNSIRDRLETLNTAIELNTAKVTESTTVTSPLVLTNYDLSIPAATNAAAGYASAAHITAIEANTAKNTNVSTALSVGTVGENTVAITSDGGADDVVLPAATVSTAGMFTVAKWAEVVANNAKETDDDIGVAEVYDATNWDADTSSPQKNDVRDKIETMITAIGLNTAKNTNVSTALSVGTVGENTVAITSDGGADDVVLPAATVSTAGMFTAAKWAEVVANNAKETDDDIGVAEVYDATNWDADTSSPQKNDVRDKIETMVTAIGLNTAKVISDTAYDATSWDANTDAATKNSIRDRLETLNTAIGLNTAKNTNVPTALSTGTVTATTYGITSDGGADDIVLPEADTNNAGLLGADKWDEIVANTAKVTNATHTGEVTGATALVLDPTCISGKVDTTIADTDYVLFWDVTDGLLKKVDAAELTAGGGVSQLSDLSDVVSATNTDKFALMANGTTGYVGRALVEADISDLQSYLTTLSGHNAIELDDITSAGSGSIITSAERTVVGNTSGTNTGDDSGTDDQTAAEVPITDTGSIITATDVEGALQENRTAIDLNTAKVISDTAYDATSWDANTDAATKNSIRDRLETLNTAIGLNTAKDTNVPTALSTGTVTATTYGITSDGGADDLVLPEADTNNAGLLGADKWDEIVANTNKTAESTTVTTPITLNGTSVGIVNQGTATQVLHGNAAGNAAFGAIVDNDVPNDITINLAAAVSTITGLAPDTQNTYARTQYLIPYASTTTAWGQIPIGTDGQVLTSGGAGVAPSFEAAAGGGGAFTLDTGVVREDVSGSGAYASDDFVFGSPQLADDTNTDHDSRMFFDKSKSAFRAGYVTGAQWDDANVSDHSIAIGRNTTASGWGSTSIGYATTASASYATARGYYTDAGGENSSAMGFYANASGEDSVAIGYYVVASGRGSVAMGENTTASGRTATAMGYNTQASGDYSTAMGYDTEASGSYGSFAEGYYSSAYLCSQHASASGKFAANGDAQYSRVVLRADTPSDTPEVMYIDNSSSNKLVVPAETAWYFFGHIVATNSDCASSAGYTIQGLIHRDAANNTELIYNSVTEDVDELIVGVTLSADDTNEALNINVTGVSGVAVRWVAYLELVEVGF